MKFDLDIRDTGSLDLEVDARGLAKAGAEGLRVHTGASIEASMDPATGAPKKALKPRSEAKPGRKGGRGYDTGKLAGGLRVRSTGSPIRGQAKVTIPKGRHAFVASEAKRGVVYLSGEGLAAEAIDDAVSGELEEQT